MSSLIESVRSLKAKLGLDDRQVSQALSICDEDWEQIVVKV